MAAEAQLQSLSSQRWRLVGLVCLEGAAKLAQQLPWQAAAQAAPSSAPKHSIELQEAQGGTALLLVLLAWQRQAQVAGLCLAFEAKKADLHPLVELCNLEEALPWVWL